MTRPLRAAFQAAIFLLLVSLLALPAWADGLSLTAAFGIAGRYRPGGWCPVTVTVHNTGAETGSGQVQVLAAPPTGGPNSYAGPGGAASSRGAIFSCPLSLSGSMAQQITVYVRGIDPARDKVTVQIAEGRERGDGRILARTDNDTARTTPTITGTPLGNQDIFLIGYAGSPGAFTFLNGQNFGLRHRPGGATADLQGSPNGFFGTAQTASPAAADLPDKAAGYSGADAFLLRGDAPLDGLTEAQTEAIRGWVASGGHLIVFCPGADPTPFSAPFYQGLLPAAVGPPGADGRLRLTPLSMPGVKTASVHPLLITGPYGAGQVTVTTEDPAAQPPSAGPGRFWPAALTSGSAASALLPYVAVREEVGGPGYYYGPGRASLSDAVMRAPSLDAPATGFIGLFLLVYLLVLVPVNYLVLKRLDRKEMAWVTIPALVVIFAVGTFGVGYAAKGGAVFVNRAAIVETASGQREAGVYAAIGLFSPHRTSYDITLSGPNTLAALPVPAATFGRRSAQGAEVQSGGQTRFVQTAEGTTLRDASVNMWAMRAFNVQATTDLGGTVDSALTQAATMTGTITNHTAHDLTDCMVLYRGQWQTPGNLARGASCSVGFGAVGPGGNQNAPFVVPNLAAEATGANPRGPVRARMQAALAAYVRSLGERSGYYYSGGGPVSPPSAYALAPNEALLLGWSSDAALAGPQPRVDGRTVPENDAVLVVVHLPIAGA